MSFANVAGQLTRVLSLFGQFMLFLSLPMLLMGYYTISWLAIFLLIFAPMLSSLLQLALSRAREYNADLGAVEIMGDPEALASALAKMEEYQKQSVRRMFWPMSPKFPEASWLRTHPPTPERIRRLLDIRGNYYDTGNHVDSVSWGGYRVPGRTENRLFVHG